MVKILKALLFALLFIAALVLSPLIIFYASGKLLIGITNKVLEGVDSRVNQSRIISSPSKLNIVLIGPDGTKTVTLKHGGELSLYNYEDQPLPDDPEDWAEPVMTLKYNKIKNTIEMVLSNTSLTDLGKSRI